MTRDGSPQRSVLWKSLQGLCRIATTLLFDLKVYGKHHIPERGGALILSNHQSYLDPIAIAVHLNRPVSYMAKSELFESSRFFRWLISSLHAFPVRRGKGDVGAIKQSIARLHDGYVLNIYPEGTRTLDGEIGKIQHGVVLIVRRAEVPIVPAVIDGSFHAWPKRGSKLLRPHPVRIMYGPAMNVEGLKPDQIVALIDRTLRAMLAELRRKESRQ